MTPLDQLDSIYESRMLIMHTTIMSNPRLTFLYFEYLTNRIYDGLTMASMGYLDNTGNLISFN